MPIFNESYEVKQHGKHHRHKRYVYSLADCFQRGLPVTSIEFNPPPVSSLEKQELDYWRRLETPDPEDLKIFKSLKGKIKSIQRCRSNDAFASITDSAAGILRMHNLTMIALLSDPVFTERHLKAPPIVFEPRRTIIHLTRNHNIPWLEEFIIRCKSLGFWQILVITGDPLKEVKFKPVTAEQALALHQGEGAEFRLKNSVELLTYLQAREPDFFMGVGHNPFMKRVVAEKHFMAKVHAGSRFVITQPVSYYDECWSVMDEFAQFRKTSEVDIPIILGVFNYSVPCNNKGFREEIFQKRYKLWKRLFGYVPEGVRQDYDRGLNGVEIMARSINKLSRMGYHHFDVMNAERNGSAVLENRRRMAHESDRISGMDEDSPGSH